MLPSVMQFTSPSSSPSSLHHHHHRRHNSHQHNQYQQPADLFVHNGTPGQSQRQQNQQEWDYLQQGQAQQQQQQAEQYQQEHNQVFIDGSGSQQPADIKPSDPSVPSGRKSLSSNHRASFQTPAGPSPSVPTPSTSSLNHTPSNPQHHSQTSQSRAVSNDNLRRPPPHVLPHQSNSSGSLLDVPEYSLRRKTPNGTLAAGYDGSPGSGVGAIQPPATKHILVSIPTSSGGGEVRREGEMSLGAAGKGGGVANNDGASDVIRAVPVPVAVAGQQQVVNVNGLEGSDGMGLGQSFLLQPQYQQQQQQQQQQQILLNGANLGLGPAVQQRQQHHRQQSQNVAAAAVMNANMLNDNNSHNWMQSFYPATAGTSNIAVSDQHRQLHHQGQHQQLVNSATMTPSSTYHFQTGEGPAPAANHPVLRHHKQSHQQQQQQQQPPPHHRHPSHQHQQQLQPQPHQQQHPHQQFPTVIPTVLPYVFQQPSPGPTAPAGVGPYGPYWPDGAYIPYRPAALRDARYYPQLAAAAAQVAAASGAGAGAGPNAQPGHPQPQVHMTPDGQGHHQHRHAAQPLGVAPGTVGANVTGLEGVHGASVVNNSGILEGSAGHGHASANPANVPPDAGMSGIASRYPLHQIGGHRRSHSHGQGPAAAGAAGYGSWDGQHRQTQPTLRHQHQTIQQHLAQSQAQAQVQAQAQAQAQQRLLNQHHALSQDPVTGQTFGHPVQNNLKVHPHQQQQPQQLQHPAPSSTFWEAGNNLTLALHGKTHHAQHITPYPPPYAHPQAQQQQQQQAVILQQYHQQQQQHLTHANVNYQAPPPLANASVPSTATTSSFPLPPSNPTNIEEFKEVLLTWAHSVYVDLLAYIHETQRRQRSVKSTAVVNVGGVNFNVVLNNAPPQKPKPSIYPKPPRQPGSDFSASSAGTGATATKGEAAPRTIEAGPASGAVVPQSLDQTQRQTQLQVKPHVLQDTTNLAAQTTALTQAATNVQANQSAAATAAAASAQRLFGLGQATIPLSPTANAKTALDMLSSLCIESNWNWIDGMLLGGCLAYGLEDYGKAWRWYSRILERDSTHVEALSNLAATLLALDRREEALEKWKQAVHLRPEYFEAVEHLIGLLCSTGRAQEAVNIIKFVENSLRLDTNAEAAYARIGGEAEQSVKSQRLGITAGSESLAFDYERDHEQNSDPTLSTMLDKEGRAYAKHPHRERTDQPGFGSSGYAIAGADNGRILGLIHAKGNMLYALGENAAAAAAFEEAVLIGAGRARKGGIQGLIKKIVAAFLAEAQGLRAGTPSAEHIDTSTQIVLLYPGKALQTASLAFPSQGIVPGFLYIPEGLHRRAAISTMSNSLLSLAKIYQDNMAASASQSTKSSPGRTTTVGDILALYYLSLSLQPSPSTANNVGILLASIQQNANTRLLRSVNETTLPETLVAGVVPGSGVALALAYYYYGLNLDAKHAHLYTNLGSLLKDIGHLAHAIRMYEQAVQCDPNFDIALANLANALKDSGRVNDSIVYYRRAVQSNPEFAEAVCGLANSLNSVCNWGGRGGIATTRGVRDRWHVDDKGFLFDGKKLNVDSGWIKRVIDIVDKQLKEGRVWGCGLLSSLAIDQDPLITLAQLGIESMSSSTDGGVIFDSEKVAQLASLLRNWSGHPWEGARLVRFIERTIRYIGWRWYQDRYVHGKDYPLSKYNRPRLPMSAAPPNAPTVLPFHTFTTPLSAKQIRHISQRNGLRISCATLRSPWLPSTVYRPPAPPNPCLNVGYVSSDFNNHPLAHLMQSVFGLHNPAKVKAFCYATTPSDGTVHRQQIEREAPVFRDVSTWPTDRLVQQIVNDDIHILVNLNGYTRGARNEVFAARPAPIHMSFMGFAGTLGAEWCDYIYSDEHSIPLETLSKSRRDLSLEEQVFEDDHSEDEEDWIYDERIVYARHSFFCCDHKQSAPQWAHQQIPFTLELDKRWEMRKEMFPDLPDDYLILGNFNQLYKIDPSTFRTWLRILAAIPNAILWLLRFPDLGEKNLRQSAQMWAGEEVASRLIFTDVAPKKLHISRARICDLFIDTPECNAHTTAADILWSGTPLLTFPRYPYKMCSRMASSILSSAFPLSKEGREAATHLIVSSDEEYEARAIELCRDLRYLAPARPQGRLNDMRKLIFENRFNAPLFDTKRWVEDLEEAYEAVWNKWVKGEEGDIWLPRELLAN